MALGYVLRYKESDRRPSGVDHFDGLMCVNKEFCVEAEVYRLASWSRRVTEFMAKDKSLSFHKIIPKDNQGYRLNTVYGYVGIHNESRANPPLHQVYVPRIDKIKVD